MSRTFYVFPAWSAEAWGALGTWVGSVATAAALVAAVLAWRGARDRYRVETRRDEERWADERQSQASLVAGWVAFAPTAGEGTIMPSHFLVRNASLLPI